MWLSFLFLSRPALVLSSAPQFNNQIEHTILAMITTAHHNPWPLDIAITNLATCGLLQPSIIRFKLFTLDNLLIKTKIGTLDIKDQEVVCKKSYLVFKDLLKIDLKL